MEKLSANNIESEWERKLGVAIVCLYGYPHKHDTEPFAGQVLKQQLDENFPDQVETSIHLLGHNNETDGEIMQFAQRLVDDDKTQVIGVSIPQGTLSTAETFLSQLYEYGFSGQVVLGHALPTYQPELFLEKFPQAIIVQGWGENAFSKIVEGVLNDSDTLSEIPNLAYLKDGTVTTNSIVWPNEFIPSSPYNPSTHLPRVEASRGCHHNVCTYCTRPLQDRQQPTWMRIPPEIVIQSLSTLKANGVEKFAFTDEDFFGDDLEGAMEIANALKEMGGMTFSLDLRADSIVNIEDSHIQAEYRDELIRTLIEAGMSLVFVGVETLSDTQLKRYGKGVSPEVEIAAIKKISSLSVPMELGLITFDPLLTIQELAENIEGLERSGVWVFGSQLFSELRVIGGNPYSKIVAKYGLKTGFDPNFFTHDHSYLYPEVQQIRDTCIPIKQEVDSIYTSARNVYRRNPEKPDFITTYLARYRRNQLEVLKALLERPGDAMEVASQARQNNRLNIIGLREQLLKNADMGSYDYSELLGNIELFL